MGDLKELFTGTAAKIGAGFTIGWALGRTMAVGFENGGTLIGGLIVGLIATVVLHMFLRK